MSIESRKAIPVIGMVSSGKSTFLNSLLGIDVLEAKNDVTTKFVCIIRNNSKLSEPIFYHLNLINDSKTNDYIYNQDGEISKGNEEIKKKISQINSDEYSKVPNYKNLFYMLEIKINNIVNDKFLEKYDFYDIPGLNENIIEKEQSSSSENGKNIDTKKNKDIHQEIKFQEMKYIKELFPLLKKKIDFGIIVIDSNNYYYPSNINIINKIYSIMQARIKNYMFILNKIDKVENPEETIKKCKGFFTNNIDSSIFRIEDNFFQPLNSKQFKNEIFMKSDFESFYLYFFNKFCEQGFHLNENISFLDFISVEITKDIENQDDKKDEIETLAENVKEEDYSKVKEIYEKVKSTTNLKINYGFDFDDEDCENILKAFYSKFLDKSFIPTFSKNIQEILQFFKDFGEIKPTKKDIIIKNDNFIKKLEEQEKMIENFQKVFHRLKNYINEDKNDNNIIDSLEKDLKELKIIVSNQRKIFIPLIGVSSSGKSTILNDIVGYKIFPESGEECTRRGIIIQHSFDGTSKLFEVNIETSVQNNYYIFKENTNLNPIEGKDKIYSFFESVNYEYSNKEEKCFFILKTPIKFLDDYDISEDLKRRISFIDLPGSNTEKNSFNDKKGELTIYQKLLKVCTSFIFVNRVDTIKTDENKKILETAYSIHGESKIKNKYRFLENCTFVMNIFDINKEEEKDIKKIQRSILNDLSGEKEDNLNIINATFFNAKQYKEFLKDNDYYSNATNVISSLKVKYRNQFNSLNFFFTLKKEKNFPKYCLKILKENLENLSLKYDSNFKCDDEFKSFVFTQIKDIMKQFNLPLKSKEKENIEKIANILKYIQINIKNSSFYKESYCEDFFSQLVTQIKQSDSYMENEFYEYLDNTMEQFNSFFEIPPEKRNTFAQKEFLNLEKKTKKDIELLFKDINFSENFQNKKTEIINILNDKIANINTFIKEHNNKVEESYTFLCKEIVKTNIDQLSLTLDDKLKKLQQDFSKIKENLYLEGKKINNKFEINNSFLNDLDKIILIDSIKKSFGIENYLAFKIDDLMNGIILNFGFWDSIGHFLSNLFRKNKNILKDNLKEMRKRFEEIFKICEKTFVGNFEEVREEITNKITKVLLTQSTDLSNISKSDFNQAKELFNLTKEILFEDGTSFIIAKNSLFIFQLMIYGYISFLKFFVGLFFFEEVYFN